MANKERRVIIDTNLWISFLIAKDFSKIDHSILKGTTILLFSKELLGEFLEVVSRPKFERYFSPSDIVELLDFINLKSEFVDVTSDVKICRDEKDNFLLSLAVDGRADFLVTGDDDLLDLKEIENTKIITIKQFIEFL